MCANSNLWVLDKAPLRRVTQQPDPGGNTGDDLWLEHSIALHMMNIELKCTQFYSQTQLLCAF